MLILDAAFVEKHLTPRVSIALMEETLKAERAGTVTQYQRTAHVLPDGSILGLMPAYDEKGYFGVKVISVCHGNGAVGLPSHQGQIILFGKDHGEVLAAVDAMSVTKIRTGAVSAAAAKALAGPESSVLAVLGCGAQGESHLAAMAAAFSLTEFRCFDQNPAKAGRLAETAAAMGLAAQACASAREAVCGADLICTVTPAREPVLEAAWVKPGAHVCAVGACTADAREIDSALAAESRFYCDSREAVLFESGDFLIPLREGCFGEDHLLGTIGGVLSGQVPGRLSPADVTVFDAVGMAAEDIACAVYLYELAAAR